MKYRLTCSVFLTLTLTLFALAQGTKNPGRGTSTPPTTTTTPTRPTMNAPDMTMGQRAFFSGKVVLDDGTRLTESATILTICRGHRQAVTHYRFHGSFSFEFGDSASAAATLAWPLRMRTRQIQNCSCHGNLCWVTACLWPRQMVRMVADS